MISDNAAATKAELAPDQIDGLNPIRAFIDRGDASVAEILGSSRFLDEAHAAMDLDTNACELTPQIGTP